MKYYLTPTRRMNNLRRSFDRWFDDPWTAPDNGEERVHIPMNVTFADDVYTISAVVPGLMAEDLEIQVLDDTLTLQGELREELPEDASYLRREIPAGKFRRVIRFPVAVDSAKAEAIIEHGVLKLLVPVAEAARPKSIEIKVK